MSDSKTHQPYITKRILISKSKEAILEASEKAMDTIGYIVVARDGWIIKEYKNGTIEKVEQLENSGENLDLILD